MTLLSVKQAAEELGVSAKTVYRMLADGELAEVRVRGAIRISRLELDRFRRENTTRRGETAADYRQAQSLTGAGLRRRATSSR